jgi:protein-disulfide isomerase
MPIPRRTLLSVALLGAAMPAAAAAEDARKAERALGSPGAPQIVTEWFSLTCSHCAAFALGTLPEIQARWIAPGKLRWVFRDLPTDQTALLAAQVARYLPPDRYEAFLNALFASQDRWAFASAGRSEDALWTLANAAGMERATFAKAAADTDLRNWILAQSMDAEKRWHVDATPSFLVNGKLYAGAMTASEFASLLAS